MDQDEVPAAANADNATAGILASPSTGRSNDTVADPKQASDRTQLLDTADHNWTVRLRAYRGREQRFAGARLRVVIYLGFEAAGEPAHTTVLTCNDDGEVAWRLPAPTQTVTVQVQSADSEVVAREVVSVVPVGEVAPLLEVRLLPLDHIVLGVVTTQEGKPVPGARISWARSVPPIHTDVQGRFRLRVSSVYGSLRYYVVAPGYSRFREILYLDSPGTTNVEVRLKPGFRAFGTITDTDGRPLEGVEVSTFWARYTGERTLTDAEGNYQLDTLDLDRDRHHVVATLQGYARTQGSTKGSGNDARIDLTMKRAAMVTGTVFGPDGRPLAGATVGVSRGSRPARTGKVVTREDGRFTLQHQPKGKLYLWTHKRGFAIDRRRIDSAAEGSAVDLQVHLRHGHFVAGRVTDGEGQPVAGARVYFFFAGGSAWLGANETTDADGRYRVEDLPEQPADQKRKLSLSVWAPGHVHYRKRGLILDSENVDLVLQRSMVLRGRVVDGRTGAPLQDFRIRVLKRSWGGVGMPWVGKGKRFQNTDGRWEATRQRIKPGTSFDLEAIADGYAPTVLKQVIATPDMAPEAALFKMFPGVVLNGQVLDQATGQLIMGAKITLVRPGQRQGRPGLGGDRSQRSSAEGTFLFEHVAPGALLLKVEHKDRPPFLHGPLVVPDTGTMNHVIVFLGTAGRIEGVLTDPDNKALSRVKVTLTPGSIGRRQLWLRSKTTRTDATGAFHFDDLVNTDYVLTATGNGPDGTTSVFRSEVSVRSDGPTRVALQLQGSCSLKGTVHFPASAGSGVSVRIHQTSDLAGNKSKSKSKSFRAGVKSDGFRLRGLPEGIYSLQVIYRLDGKRKVHNGPKDVVVRPGTDNQVSVQIPPQ